MSKFITVQKIINKIVLHFSNKKGIHNVTKSILAYNIER